MFTRAIVRFFMGLSILAALSLPKAAFADSAKVYFEDDCLAMFSAHATPPDLGHNETRVEEAHGMLRFEKTVVTETRDGEVVNTIIQIHHCHRMQAAEAL